MTTAYYLRHGLRIKDIASVRGVTGSFIASQISQLRRMIGSKDPAAVLEALAPIVDARADELYIEGRKPRKTGRRRRKWTPLQVQFIGLRTSGLALPQVAKEMGLSLSGAGGLEMRVYRKLRARSVSEMAIATQRLRLPS